jgi:hypothetical protein
MKFNLNRIAFSTIFIIGCTSLLTSCEKSYEDQRGSLEKFVAKGKIGTSPDYWLVKNGAYGPERTGLIFGYMNDFQFCSEIAELYVKKYPIDRYSCEKAN